MRESTNEFLWDQKLFWKVILTSIQAHLKIFSRFAGPLKPGLDEPQLPIGRSVTLLSSLVVERRRCSLLISSVAGLQENKERRRFTQLTVMVRVNQALQSSSFEPVLFFWKWKFFCHGFFLIAFENRIIYKTLISKRFGLKEKNRTMGLANLLDVH